MNYFKDFKPKNKKQIAFIIKTISKANNHEYI